MNKKMSKRQKNIKTKLMAAICMLLVSSIMMVSTTYAWFTLSTAPEVTGITTAVGANGNLEMALMPLSGNVNDITSAVGDSINVQDKTLANVTWGNLVDVKDAYGLEAIMLYPSALNLTASGAINTAFPVSIPEYGVDGRVTTLNVEKASFGTYVNNNFVDKIAVTDEQNATTMSDDFMGVRAIGTASGASPAQLAYKGALVNASSAAVNATKKASGVLTEKGGVLADIAIRHVNGNDNNFNDTDVANLQAILTATLGTEENPGSLLIIRNALKEYMVAYYIAENNEGYETKVAEIRALTTLNPEDTSYVPAEMKDMVIKLNAAITKAQTAQNDLNTVKAASAPYTWSQLSPIVNNLANPSSMNLNGFAIGELTSNVSQLMKDVMNGKGIVLYLQSGAGLFVDIADFCGNYAAPVTIPKIEHEKLDEPLENVEATMQTQSNISPTYLSQALKAVNDNGAPGGAGADSVLPLSDFYGYVIDLAFRTNVAGSNLQLQTTAVDRIYNGNEANEDTMGGGSAMIFKSADTNFTAARMIELMEHLKIVLFDPTDGTIIKNLVITNVTADISVAADGTVTAPLFVADATGAPSADPTIVALDQNTAKQVSVLVYLDGTNLTNADVANAAQSMIGALNLQFSSSAELVPMEYADLKNGTVTGPTEAAPTATDYTSDKVTVTEGYAASNVKFGTYGVAKGFGAVITKDGTAVTEGVTVTIGGKSATYSTEAQAWVAPATDVTEAPATVAIVVTPTT